MLSMITTKTLLWYHFMVFWHMVSKIIKKTLLFINKTISSCYHYLWYLWGINMGSTLPTPSPSTVRYAVRNAERSFLASDRFFLGGLTGLYHGFVRINKLSDGWETLSSSNWLPIEWEIYSECEADPWPKAQQKDIPWRIRRLMVGIYATTWLGYFCWW